MDSGGLCRSCLVSLPQCSAETSHPALGNQQESVPAVSLRGLLCLRCAPVPSHCAAGFLSFDAGGCSRPTEQDGEEITRGRNPGPPFPALCPAPSPQHRGTISQCLTPSLFYIREHLKTTAYRQWYGGASSACRGLPRMPCRSGWGCGPTCVVQAVTQDMDRHTSGTGQSFPVS